MRTSFAIVPAVALIIAMAAPAHATSASSVAEKLSPAAVSVPVIEMVGSPYLEVIASPDAVPDKDPSVTLQSTPVVAMSSSYTQSMTIVIAAEPTRQAAVEMVR